MMNILSLILVATSLATAGVWSPPAVHKDQVVVDKDVPEVIVKEGHRVIVVEYDEKVQADGIGNTKVSISPPHEHVDRVDHSKSTVNEESGGVKEVICDAFGKCKQVVKSVVGGGMRKVSDKVDEVEEKVKDVVEEAADKVGEVKEGLKKAVVGSKDEVVKKTHREAEMVKERARQGTDKAKEVADKIRKGADKGKEAVHDVHETMTSIGKEMGEKVKSKAKQGAEVAEDLMDNVAEKAKAGAEKMKEEGKQELMEIYDLGKQLVQHIWTYLVRTLDAVSGLVHLIGFCAAYGMAVWITFVSSNVLSKAMPRQQFGVLQSKIYPVYFQAMEYTIGMSLFGHIFRTRARLWSEKGDMFQGYNLAFALGIVMINLYYLEPQATKVMFARMKEEKEEGRGRDPYTVPESTKITTMESAAIPSQQVDKSVPNDRSQDRIVQLNQRLKKLNSRSSLANIVCLMSLTWHLLYLTQLINA